MRTSFEPVYKLGKATLRQELEEYTYWLHENVDTLERYLEARAEKSAQEHIGVCSRAHQRTNKSNDGSHYLICGEGLSSDLYRL